MRYGLHEVRRHRAAGAALGFIRVSRVPVERFAAAGAKRASLCGQIVPAGRADRKQGKTNQRQAADMAIVGEDNRAEAIE
jgi:hypothetical protein